MNEESKIDGLNNFDVIYYINLEHRKDRFEHINKVLSETNIDKNKINRIEAIHKPNFGILGCAKSHSLALETFLKTPDTVQNCIIFEDDFIFNKSQNIVNQLLNRFYNEIKEFDVLMLASNTYNESSTNFSFITKILNAQTLSGYIVSKKFAPILLENYNESIEKLEFIGCKVHALCFDIYMKQLQPSSNWYCLKPKIGQQIPSFSDIEKKFTNYGC
jgi:hypothetical protein